MLRIIFALILCASPVFAKGEKSGDFDYYVLALSWTPSWCEYEGDRRKSPQCDAGREFGFTLHGLWPQYNDGSWPSYCKSSHRPPSKSLTASMGDIMGTSGLAWHQWNKHGVCSGLSPAQYYELSRRAYESVQRPAIFSKIKQTLSLPASVVEDAFQETNAQLDDNELQLTCKAGRIQEARICLTKDLELRACSSRMRDCTLQDAEMAPIR
ncbi:ribonuclease T [Amylibacter kogurei]|uniref:Ribonuclease T n=1 Tax=Paramylibacter kogurei TaxID=1889778 RepID=A0A2G5KAP3_9RHOB|nr:ribonuclease T2 [Amylibacter kogurei]PIB26122.1 ribonuclease T [Amylibacter kogurei]